ncbi:uncharacterized protein LOC133923209 [Phragmites australis]|uniref:uncharacterized protein LOC133923209 n=1 Tax=Phragmites australis TaxID=29695 RepID=UPI002D7973F2|nr:uncharacterized protein LOC133923209 [Phragmites australis]
MARLPYLAFLVRPAKETCNASSTLTSPPGLLDYVAIHSCLLRGGSRLSLPLLALLLLLQFCLLTAAAGAHFNPIISRLAASLRLSPSMADITVLALNNGTPDVFASATALGGTVGMPRAGLVAILSTGAFVSAFVVGVFTLFYAFFIGLVFYMHWVQSGWHVNSAELEMVNGIVRVVTDFLVTMEDSKQKDPTLCVVLNKNKQRRLEDMLLPRKQQAVGSQLAKSLNVEKLLFFSESLILHAMVALAEIYQVETSLKQVVNPWKSKIAQVIV